ncbi:MAG: hypothetical protein Rhirs2KO_17940 [Rhizobiaceae bacterium]
MTDLNAEISAYRDRKSTEASVARISHALQLSCGIDLAAAHAASASERVRLGVRLERLLKRERMRGLERHWSYDLNRHIAIKQSLDWLRPKSKGGPEARL